MLVYLATYPRSGNAFLQQIIRANFGLFASQIVAGVNSREAAIAQLARMAPALQQKSDPADGYVVSVSKAGENWSKRLLPIDLELLTEDVRRTLAESAEPFFLKLHDRPFRKYLPGEYVIQLVRHPGAVLWSYFRYANDVDLGLSGDAIYEQFAPTVENVIRGHVGYGHWSSYHADWDAVRKAIGSRFLFLRYEEVAADPATAATRVAQLASLPLRAGGVTDFARYRERHPGWDLRGTSEGYESYFSAPQLALLWQQHGAWAERFGYAPPAEDRAAPKEQVERLERLVEMAWRKAREQNRSWLGKAVSGIAARVLNKRTEVPAALNGKAGD